ncbi:conserved oligomeric Golgi complex subunit 2-like [Saccostrea echinata]|uniref:conserved oligomeric Golgi complex subunit 2-like n=1 Tax=Saccostrea echinata TaxID=191078 RepID=UPI002A81ABEA|nr:conserved oligomeric Golgi complex subunit 2-like [Saccostrea echinata]
MTGDPNKGLPLPSGPASLCFDKDVFMQENFDVDQFVIECRRRVPLENLRDDLNTYLKILRSAMIELINKDYADFVNLSTNLVGMDKAIGNLTTPLEHLKGEIMTVKTAMEDAIQAVEEKLKKREQIRQKKASLQRLMNIIHSVEKIEKLLGIHSRDNSSTSGQLNGQLIERVANEFNKLQFYVTKSKGLPLVEEIKPRIANITTTLQYSLEGQLVEGLQKGNIQVLHQCLRTYALIDKIKDAENLFRQNIVKPYMEEVISEKCLKANGLEGMYGKVLEFMPKHCRLLKEVTLSGGSGSSEVVRGFDFLVNAVWPEIVTNIEARTHSIFAPGNPDVFHKRFKTSMQFLDDFERQCGTQASVKHLRDHSSYHAFMTKWSLPVYYQIRFQDIAGELESALDIPFNKPSGSSDFLLHSTAVLWASLHRCWSDEVYLDLLCNRFWKLNLQLLSRYSHWLDECFKTEIEQRKSTEKEETDTSKSKLSVPTDKQNGSGDKASTPKEGETTPPSPPVTNGQLLSLLSDALKLSSHIFYMFDSTIKPKLTAIGCTSLEEFKECLTECSEEIKAKLPKFQAHLVEEITTQCSAHLKQVNDIPRLYRRTNKEVPSKQSSYVINLLKPIKMFTEEHSDILDEKLKLQMFQEVLDSLTESYYSATSDVLMSVKKVEDSLKRLKKNRGSDKSSGNQGMTDDDKIREQFIVDIDNYSAQLNQYGDFGDMESLKKLRSLAEEAKSAMTTAQ